jgi:uridylate kinase
MIKYKRILLKLSGEALLGKSSHGIDAERLNEYTSEIKEIADLGTQVGIVIGGGNIFRGMTGINKGVDRVKGDYMGMLATVINSLALQSSFESIGAGADVFTAIQMEPVGIRYTKQRVLSSMDNGRIAIFSFGTGNPYFTTDTAAALRAIETESTVLLKGTRVDGVYTADPEKNPNATKIDELTFDEAYQKDLQIMDRTAFTMCRENDMPVIVFDMNTPGNLKKLISGEKIGTLVKK